MENKRLLYPYGFCRTVPVVEGDTRDGVVVEQSVVALYRQLFESDPTVKTKAYMLKATDLAASLFGPSLVSWANDQLANPNLYDANFDFFVDTLNFIVSGKRRYPIGNWEHMLKVKPEPITVNRKGIYAEWVKSIAPFDACYLSAWLKQEQGLTDMVTTLFLFFGEQPPETDKDRFRSFRPAMII